MRDICTCLTSSYPTLHEVFSEVLTLTRLFLVIPATSATAERSFSTMRRLQTYIRSTMTTERLNSVMVLNVHIGMLDNMMKPPLSTNVAPNERRAAIFGSGRPA